MSFRLNDKIAVIHYEIENNESHAISAQVEAQASLYYAKALNYISSSLGVISELKTSALREGSVLKLFHLIVKAKADEEYVRYFLWKVFYGLFVDCTPVSSEYILNGLDDIQKEKGEEILNKYALSNSKLESLNGHMGVKIARSGFYKTLSECSELEGIDLAILDGDSQDYACNKHVDSTEFKNFVLEESYEEVIDNNAVVFIVSPVIVKGRDIKWNGFFEGASISFKMESNEFKTKAQNGEVDFRTGFNVKCRLQYNQHVDENGETKKNEFKVLDVYEYGIDEHFEMTIAGKRKKADENMLSLFNENDF